MHSAYLFKNLRGESTLQSKNPRRGGARSRACPCTAAAHLAAPMAGRVGYMLGAHLSPNFLFFLQHGAALCKAVRPRILLGSNGGSARRGAHTAAALSPEQGAPPVPRAV